MARRGPSKRCLRMPPPRCASGSWSRAAGRRACSTASSAPRTGSPGSPPMSRRSASLPPMPSACSAAARLGEIEELLVRIGLGEYLAQIAGGIPMSQGEMVRPADLGLSLRQVAARVTPALEGLIATGNTAQNRARLVELMREQPRRDGRRLRPRRNARTRSATRCASSPTARSSPHAHDWHLTNSYIPLDIIAHMSRARRVRAHHSRRYRRHGARQGIDVRRLRGTVARLYRRRLARHALGDRRRAHSRRRHRRAEAQMAAEDRVRRGAADRGVHRAEHRLRPRLAQDARGARRATSTRSTATRPGSPIRCAPT